MTAPSPPRASETRGGCHRANSRTLRLSADCPEPRPSNVLNPRKPPIPNGRRNHRGKGMHLRACSASRGRRPTPGPWKKSGSMA
eukprot:1176216-Pyramimonas_sp.AAC.1